MKAFFWVLGLFALAVGLVVAARYNSGYVLIVLSQHRIEVSVNFAVALLLGLVVALHLALRAIEAVLRLPTEVREFHESRRRERGSKAFMDAVQAYLGGRFGRAEKAAAQAMALEHAPALSGVIAARAAHEMRAFEARDRYLAGIETEPEDADYLRQITQAELLLDERRYLDALAVLDRIKDKHTAALRLELKAHQLARNWDRVEALLPQLDRRNVYDPLALAQLRRTATAELLRQRALDLPRLTEAWHKVPADLRRDTLVAQAAAQAFYQQGAGATGHAIVEQSLEIHWDSQLVLLYAEALGEDALEQLQKAEAWLPLHPRDAALLLTLGRLCVHGSLWGKARSYFEASLAVESTYSAHLELARLARATGSEGEAARHSAAAMQLVLAQLEDVTGGRRRRPI